MIKESKYCCENHIDMAFDDFLLQNETFPYLEKIENTKCSYCTNDAQYVLKLNINNECL